MVEETPTLENYKESMFAAMQKAFKDAEIETIPNREEFESSMEQGEILFASQPAEAEPKPFQFRNAILEGFRAEAHPWGPTLIFPKSAMDDLETAKDGRLVLMGLIGCFAPLTIPAAVIAAGFWIQWEIFKRQDKGRGIKLSTLWPTIGNPFAWIASSN
jgi:hypothetical protein